MNDAVCLVTMFFSGFQCRSLYSLKLVRFCHWHELPSATSIIVSWIWAGTDACIRSMFMMPHTCYFQQAHSVHICPISVKEYQITSLSLTAAIANGISVEQIIKVLVKLSKNTIEASQSTKICWGKSWLTRLRYKPRNQVWSRHDFGLQSLSLYWFRDFVVHVFLAFDALTDRHKWKHDNEELAGWSHNMIIHYHTLSIYRGYTKWPYRNKHVYIAFNFISSSKCVQACQRKPRSLYSVHTMSCEESFLQFIREKGRITGKLHLVLRDGRHFLESEDPQLLRHLCDLDGWQGVNEAYRCTNARAFIEGTWFHCMITVVTFWVSAAVSPYYWSLAVRIFWICCNCPHVCTYSATSYCTSILCLASPLVSSLGVPGNYASKIRDSHKPPRF